MIRLVLIGALLVGAGSAHADPLTLETVVASARSLHPAREAVATGVDRAEAQQLVAEGAFDPKLKVAGTVVPVGYYERRVVDTELRLPTKIQGITPFVGWRLGDGKFGIYDEKLRTLDYGEVRGGVDVPILRDREIDRARADIAKADRLVAAAEADIAQLELDLQREAAIAYWDWVAAGHRLTVRRAQLAIAEERASALQRRIETGDLPRIEAVDNERVIAARQAIVVSANRDVVRASEELSLYLRDAQGARRVPTLDELPPLPAVTADELPAAAETMAAALTVSPALAANARRSEAIGFDLRAAQNALLPRLDVTAFVSRDFGDAPEDLVVTQRETELGVGMVFEIPIGRSAAHGAQATARAEGRRIGAERRLLEDRVRIAVQVARADLAAATERAALASQQATLAEELATAERTRLERGDGTILLVNLREEAAADAAAGVVDATADVQRVLARIDALLARSYGP